MLKEIQEMKESLKTMLNADNVEQITALDKQLDKIDEAVDGKDKEITGLKDKIVDYVKNTSFKSSESPSEQDIGGNNKSIDDILIEEANKIYTSRQGGK